MSVDKISDPTPVHAMNGGDRPALDDRRQRPPMRVIEKRGLPRRLAVDQALGPLGAELDDPITDDRNIACEIKTAIRGKFEHGLLANRR